jgi:hypothetical protein
VSQPVTYDLAYVADAGCPDQVTFAARVEAQLVEARETTPGRARAAVTLRRDAASASGSLELTRDDGTHYVRELSAESCDAAAQGLAFVLAYALGGGDLETAPTQPFAPENAPPSQPEPATVQPAAAPASVPAERRSAWRYGLSAQLGVRTGLGPIWTLVESGLVDVRRTGSGGWSPALRAGFARSEPILRIDRVGSTELSWLAGRVEGCPLQVRLFGTLQLLPCVGAHLGQITAAGTPSGEGSGRVAEQLWLDAVGAVRLELWLWRVLSLEVQGEALVPLTPYRFAYDRPDTLVYQVPGVAFAGFVGLSVHFP